jgi:hypothetical protein
MSAQTERKPLSSYLKGLIEQGTLSEYVADVFNRLPDWKDQRSAVEEWRQRLTGPANEVVAEFEKYHGFDRPLDFLLDRNAVVILEQFMYQEESLDVFMDYVRFGLERFMQEQSCPICQKTLGTQIHIDCKRLTEYRLCYGAQVALHDAGKSTPEHESKRHEYGTMVKELEQRLASGFFKDGTPWNAPRTNTEIQMQKPAAPGGVSPNGNGHPPA